MRRYSVYLSLATALMMLTLTMSSARAGWVAYALGPDFGTASFGGGDATGIAELVPNFGDVADFGSFTAGHIALIDRGGGIFFSTKVRNAQNAGAIGAIILDHPPTNSSLGMSIGLDGNGVLVTIPSVRIEELLGAGLKSELLLDPSLMITFHLSISPNIVFERFIPDTASVPEPGTLGLCAIGLIGFFGRAWRKRKDFRVTNDQLANALI